MPRYSIYVGAPRTVIIAATIRSNYRTPLYVDPVAVSTSITMARIYNNSVSSTQSIFIGARNTEVINTYVGVGPSGDRDEAWFSTGLFTPHNPRIGIVVSAEATNTSIRGTSTSRETACVIGGHRVFGIAVDADGMRNFVDFGLLSRVDSVLHTRRSH